MRTSLRRRILTVAAVATVAVTAAAARTLMSETQRATAPDRSALALDVRSPVFPDSQRVPAPPLRVQTASFADGAVFDLAERRGSVVAMFFMAAWCPTCIPEARSLAKLQEQFGSRGFQVPSSGTP